MRNKLAIGRSFLFAGGLLFGAFTAVAQDDYQKVEFTPGFSYSHNAAVLGGSQSFNCAGANGTFAYNVTSMFALAADLSGCKAFGLNNTYGVGSRINGDEFAYVFGPRLTFRRGKFQPFFDVNFGGERLGVGCNSGNLGNACGGLTAGNLPTQPIVLPPAPSQPIAQPPSGTVIVIPRNPNATGFSRNAFAMTVGGGVDVKFNKRLAWRLFQAEYLYTRFGHECEFAVCSADGSQNSFRLQSGLVIGWGGGN